MSTIDDPPLCYFADPLAGPVICRSRLEDHTCGHCPALKAMFFQVLLRVWARNGCRVVIDPPVNEVWDTTLGGDE